MKNWSSSPYINRFLSADTIVPGYTNPQNLNRYSYVANNPLRYTDPTGHRACGDGELVDCNGNHQDPSQNPHPFTHHPKPAKDKHKDDSYIPSFPTGRPIDLRVINPTVTPTQSIDLQVTLPAQQCTSGYPCIGSFVLPTAQGTSTPMFYDVVTNPNVQNVAQSASPLSSVIPTDFGPDLGAAWDNLLSGLPQVLGIPATSLSQAVDGAISTAATYGTYAVTTAANAAINVSNSIGNAVNNAAWTASNAMDFGLSPTLPIIFYSPAANPFSTVQN